jgi:hypothetical protein
MFLKISPKIAGRYPQLRSREFSVSLVQPRIGGVKLR